MLNTEEVLKYRKPVNEIQELSAQKNYINRYL